MPATWKSGASMVLTMWRQRAPPGESGKASYPAWASARPSPGRPVVVPEAKVRKLRLPHAPPGQAPKGGQPRLQVLPEAGAVVPGGEGGGQAACPFEPCFQHRLPFPRSVCQASRSASTAAIFVSGCAAGSAGVEPAPPRGGQRAGRRGRAGRAHCSARAPEGGIGEGCGKEVGDRVPQGAAHPFG